MFYHVITYHKPRSPVRWRISLFLKYLTLLSDANKTVFYARPMRYSRTYMCIHIWPKLFIYFYIVFIYIFWPGSGWENPAGVSRELYVYMAYIYSQRAIAPKSFFAMMLIYKFRLFILKKFIIKQEGKSFHLKRDTFSHVRWVVWFPSV